MNIKLIIYIVFDISFLLLANIFINGYDINPKAIPSIILKVKGIKTITKNAGIASDKLLKSIEVILLIIKLPIIINIGAIASSGIIPIKGIARRDINRQNAVINAVKPVLPPAATPAVPSTVDTEGLVPKSPQAILDNAIEINDLFCFSGASNKPVTCPWSRPIFSNTKIKVIEKVAIQKLVVNIAEKSNLNNISLYSLKLGRLKVTVVISTNPKIIAPIVPTTIDIKNAPGIFFINRNNVISNIAIKNKTLGFDKGAILTIVDGSWTIRPPFCNPKNVINKPIPIVIDSFSECGIEVSNILDSFVDATIKNNTPAMKTLAKAWLNVSPIFRIIV